MTTLPNLPAILTALRSTVLLSDFAWLEWADDDTVEVTPVPAEAALVPDDNEGVWVVSLEEHPASVEGQVCDFLGIDQPQA